MKTVVVVALPANRKSPRTFKACSALKVHLDDFAFAVLPDQLDSRDPPRDVTVAMQVSEDPTFVDPMFEAVYALRGLVRTGWTMGGTPTHAIGNFDRVGAAARNRDHELFVRFELKLGSRTI